MKTEKDIINMIQQLNNDIDLFITSQNESLKQKIRQTLLEIQNIRLSDIIKEDHLCWAHQDMNGVCMICHAVVDILDKGDSSTTVSASKKLKENNDE